MNTTVDLSEFRKLNRRSEKRPCQLELALRTFKPAEQAQLVAALAVDKSEISGAAIVSWLKQRDQFATVSAVTSHRRGTCRCHD